MSYSTLFSDDIHACSLPFARENKRSWKADKGTPERHSLPRRADVPWLFFTRNGTRLAAITREWYEIRELFGRPELRIQDLRHSFANFLVSIGINQRDLRGILGHYKPETLALVRQQAMTRSGGKA